MSTIVVTLLPVGQGAMNLIEIYDGTPDDPRLIHLSLIDCGTDKKPENIDKSVNYVAAKMNNRHNSSTDGLYLDYVLFTHRDRDHWSLFNTIIEKAFGTLAIHNPNNRIRFLQHIINDMVSEDFRGNMEWSDLSYTRTYSVPTMNHDNTYAEYKRAMNNTQKLKVKDSWLIYNAKQNCGVLLELDFISHELRCSTYSPAQSTFIKAEFSESAVEGAANTIIKFNASNTISCESTLENYADHWKVALYFLSYLVDNNYPSAPLINSVMQFLCVETYRYDFISYTPEKIISELNSKKPITPIIGRFLWGGYAAADINKNTGKLTGVGKLRRDSEILAADASIELSQFRFPFRLLGNIRLDVLECLSARQLIRGIPVSGAESSSNIAILKNGTSAVSLLSVSKNERLKFLFTGDATIHTFYAMHDNDMLQYATGAVWTAPHHGSYTTAKGVFNNDTSLPDNKRFYFPYFFSLSSPQGMVIESGYQNKYGHPHHTFYDWVQPYLPQTTGPAGLHFVYTNTNDLARDDAIFEISACASPLYSGVTSAKLPTEPNECADLPRPVYMVHQYIADENDAEFRHLVRPIELIFDQVYSADLGSASANYALPAALPPQEPGLPPPPQELFFRRK